MALSTNRTLITQTGINTHQVLNVGGLDSAGIATFSNFKTGSTNVHNIGIEAAGINVLGGDTPIGAGATIYDDGGARFSGVVTATSFHGDISQATGAAAGLGTALSQTQTDPLNKVYYTNKVLSISTTTTIDHPATANLAYTQYGDIKIEDGHDLIIKTDDDFKYDILGISTTKLAGNHFPNGLTGDLTGDVTGDVTGNIKNGTSLIDITQNGRIEIDIAGTEIVDINGNGVDVVGGVEITGNVKIADTIEHIGDSNTKIRFPAADTISFETGGTERLRIDSNGNVTKPTNFHILVKRSENQTGYNASNTTDPVIWNSVVTGESSTGASSHFNTSTGLFTAPVTGLYFFHTAVNSPNITCEGGWLIINGSRVYYSAFNPNNAQTSDATITYHVTAGETVGVKWYHNGQTNGTINANDHHTWWRIVLLG